MVLVAVPRASRSCEHFPDGFDLHLLPLLCEAPIQLGLVCKIVESRGQDGFGYGRSGLALFSGCGFDDCAPRARRDVGHTAGTNNIPKTDCIRSTTHRQKNAHVS